VFAVAAAALCWPVGLRAAHGRRVASHPAPVRLPLPWRHTTAWLVALFMSLQSWQFYSLLAWVSPFYESRGWSATDAGYLLSVFSATQVISGVAAPVVAHHLPDPILVRFLRWLPAHAARRWLILDLHRHWIPWTAVWAGTRAMRYHFADAIGPAAARKPQCDPFTGALDATTYGLDEFLAIAEGLGAAVTLVAPWVDGTPEEAAALVAYVNAPAGSTVPLGVDAFGQSGTVHELYELHDLLPGSIVNAALAALSLGRR